MADKDQQEIREILTAIRDRYKGVRRDEEDEIRDDADCYDPKLELIKAIEAAHLLRRPLLLEGEAGSGKTTFAYYLAWALNLPIFRWNITPTSRRRDGFYEYDALLRLHDVQIRANGNGNYEPVYQPENVMNYIRLGPLGKAFVYYNSKNSPAIDGYNAKTKEHTQREYPAIVLLDEVDKADEDLLSALLSDLEAPWKFDVREAHATFEIRNEYAYPIVILTSNNSKRLPDAFLRRCVYHRIGFPDDEQLKTIIKKHAAKKNWENNGDWKIEEIAKIIEKFLEIRKKTWEKKPTTSELLDGIGYLLATGRPLELSEIFAGLLAKTETDITFPDKGHEK